jgi:hypothetical protein
MPRLTSLMIMIVLSFLEIVTGLEKGHFLYCLSGQTNRKTCPAIRSGQLIYEGALFISITGRNNRFTSYHAKVLYSIGIRLGIPKNLQCPYNKGEKIIFFGYYLSDQ